VEIAATSAVGEMAPDPFSVAAALLSDDAACGVPLA
jgi:hypothetical protein